MRSSFLIFVVLAGCQTPAPDDTRLRDADGRTLVLRGVNVRVDGVFDVTFSDGRAPRELIPTFDAGDVAELQASGFNMIRLPINWSAIEPAEGAYDESYLDRLAAVVDLCRGSGVSVLLDFHQDGWSKELCEDGAPLWATDPAPAMLVGGPGPLAGPDCHTATGAIAALRNFFNGEHQDAYAGMAQAVARRFAGDPQVLGYEIMNEPIGDDDLVAAFSARVAAAIRAADAQHLIVFEPSATRNFTNSAPIPAKKFPVAGAAYAVHVYNPGSGNPAYPTAIAGSIAAAREEADAWGTPLLITEYGAPASNEGAAWLTTFLDAADAHGASTALWLWKEQSQGEWGLYTHQPDGSWTARPIMFDAVARPFAQAVGGDLDSSTWDGTQLAVAFHGRAGVRAHHAIFWNRGAPGISCDGQPIAAAGADGSLYAIDCGGSGAHTLTLR